ncbi:hypothetical protein FACS189438_1250 [Bacteroidia bacterium]|nr:hypothetical protein FACS189438_1250 [Bacteroidia bacterium]
MKEYTLFIVVFSLLLAGCSGKEKEAAARLENAKALYERDEIIAAKNEIDTIRMYYVEEVKVMKEALTLMWKVELKEAVRNISYCDSLLPIRLEEAKRFSRGFTLEKDEKYQDAGNYIWKQQTVEKNVERSYLRCGVSEKGEMYLASVYFGGSPINHTGITVSISGLSASTASIPYDGGVNYRFKDMGNTSEVVNYKGEKGMDAVKFIYSNAKGRIKVDYTGGKPYSIYMDEASKKAVAATYELAAILSDIETMSNEHDLALKKKAYLEELQAAVYFLLGIVPDRASVYEYGIRFFDLSAEAVACHLHHGSHNFTVGNVHLAPVSLNEKAFVPDSIIF